eukprot:TRINITY_DN47149_c0_g1_i1.p1 TRINITY_DN47149_c0_g1~~TRINITY_DN47149_c0_g1_i1.p1  ORF type:complete len:1550 (+),score=417.94 TRINITY_DN47149_c0_g1_i1:130-4779(+)
MDQNGRRAWPQANSQDVMNGVLHALKEHMSDLEDMEEQRLRMMQEHEDEKVRLREQLEAEWEEESERFRKDCERKMMEIQQDMSEFQLDCERKVAAEKAETEQTLKQKRLESERQKAEMERATAEFKLECERKMAQEKADMEKQLAESKAQWTKEMSAVRADWQRRAEEEREDMARKTSDAQAECDKMVQEKAVMMQEIETFRQECERRMEAEKAEMVKQMEVFRTECEKKMEEEKKEMASEKEEMSKDMMEFRAACENILGEQREEVRKKKEEHRKECEQRMLEEKAQMDKMIEASREEVRKATEERARAAKEIEAFRAECERNMAAEQAKMQEKIAEERAATDKQLSEARKKMEAQLNAEREITDHVRHALRELPPLQAAMELGDATRLEDELSQKWAGDALPERFGECKGVVEAVVKLARERLLTWRNVNHSLADVLREAERLPTGQHAMHELCHKLFRALKEAQLTKLDLRRGDPRKIEQITETLITWQERAMLNSNAVQKAIVRKVVACPNLGPFDFADLDICLRLVDREETGNEVFLSRARAVVEDETTAPKELKSMLAHVETMLFFLKYTKLEDLRLTYTEMRKQSEPMDQVVAGYLRFAEQRYPPGGELVRFSDGASLVNDSQAVTRVLEELRRPAGGVGAPDGLGKFREIFYHWALAMRSKFDLLVLPHHTQVVCLLAFQCFLEAQKTAQTPHALIAQVGTGEGKSMIVAALAIYVVTVLKKRAHVVVDDESLLERDFMTFRSLFDAFTVTGEGGARRKLNCVLCVSEERMAGAKAENLTTRLDPDADICYCEAKHVQSFYASIARSEKRDFASYKDRVLILDEVDALVIDEEPNEPFVYPNEELSAMATRVATQLASGTTPEAIASTVGRGPHPASARVVREVCKEWTRGQQLVAGEDYVYVKERSRYCKLHAGRANTKAWSLALECRNFQDGLSREILFQERLFVMSRPRVFRMYHRILGLSGSIGSGAERRFLRDTYRAAFLEVPPFLRTCRGSPFHEPVPAPLGQERKAVYVEADARAQLARVAEVALDARQRVPVLVVARDRAHADSIVQGLRDAAQSWGLGAIAEDVIRPLSRSVYEADPEQWKENLNRATMPLGERHVRGGKSWRITVTDPRGARGTDYRVDDNDVDNRGGLLLIPLIIPSSQRDWTQFLGRTARQDRRGQYCAVLCSKDYTSRPQGAGPEIIKGILAQGDAQIANRIKASAALYNSGLRANELCEHVFSRFHGILKDPASREKLVDVCQRVRFMSVREIDQAFSVFPGVEPAGVPTEARDMGRPEEPAVATVPSTAPGVSTGLRRLGPHGSLTLPPGSAPLLAGQGRGVGGQKAVLFCLDRSASMQSNDTGNGSTRFGTCVQCVLRLLRDQVGNDDFASVVCFGSNVECVVPPTKKGAGGKALENKIASLRPDMMGGTCFYDAVLMCLRTLAKPGLVAPGAPKWLVTLTDGDDLGSRRENASGQLVNQMLQAGGAGSINMVTITVGRLKQQNLQVISSWAEQVKKLGGTGLHVSEKDASGIAMAFEVVAECLSAEVGGATEC